MSVRRGDRTRQAAVWGLAVGLACGLGARAHAQGHTPDPYNIVGEYNRQYEPYMYATSPNDQSAMPNQYRLDDRAGNRNANQFQSMLDNPDGELGAEARSALRRSPGAGVPYYKANRSYDGKTQRGSGPNQYADRSYLADQQDRNEKYFQALRETDPKKRAQLFQEYYQENLRSAKSLSGGRNAPALARERDEPNRERDRTNPGVNPPSRGFAGAEAGRRAATATTTPGRTSTLVRPPSTRAGLGAAPPPNGRAALPRTGRTGSTLRSRSRVFTNEMRGRDADENSPSAVMDRSESLDRGANTLGTRSSAPPPVTRPAP